MEDDPFTAKELYELQRRRDLRSIALAVLLFSVLAAALTLIATRNYPAIMG